MTNRRDFPRHFGDVEKPHETVAESFGDGLAGEPLTVRLGDLWSNLVRFADEGRDPDAPPRPAPVPLLDDMKGIARWD